MSALSAVTTSDYSKLIDNLAIARSYAGTTDQGAVKTEAIIAPIDTTNDVDLSNYYDNVPSGDLIQTVSENVTNAAHALDNAMVNALQNGYSVQDAVNIQQAKSAYEANLRVAQSTFEIAV